MEERELVDMVLVRYLAGRLKKRIDKFLFCYIISMVYATEKVLNEILNKTIVISLIILFGKVGDKVRVKISNFNFE